MEKISATQRIEAIRAVNMNRLGIMFTGILPSNQGSSRTEVIVKGKSFVSLCNNLNSIDSVLHASALVEIEAILREKGCVIP